MTKNILTVVLWKWKDKRWPNSYSAKHVNLVADMITRNLKIPHRIVCVTDDSRGIDLDIGIVPMWRDFNEIGHCYRRLKAFSKEMKQHFGERFISVDLDSVVTGKLDSLIPGKDCEFKIAKDTQPPTPYNGSMFYLKTGSRSQVYEDFSPDVSPEIAAALGYCACDQAWIAACLGGKEQVWTQRNGVYSFKNDIVRKRGKEGQLPKNAKIVFFHGSPKPEQVSYIPWIKKHYKDNRKRLVVIGGASCVYEDLKNYSPPEDAKVMVINDAGVAYNGRVDYWVTLHSEKLKKWQEQRPASLNQDYISVGCIKNKNVKLDKITKDWGGSSGLFACKVGLELGFDHIVLCGVPMDTRPNIFRPEQGCWPSAIGFREGWEKHLTEIRGKVFSMSGWTKEQLNP